MLILGALQRLATFAQPRLECVASGTLLRQLRLEFRLSGRCELAGSLAVGDPALFGLLERRDRVSELALERTRRRDGCRQRHRGVLLLTRELHSGSRHLGDKLLLGSPTFRFGLA